jgi:2-methylfumaryl-CoA hydratase
MTEGPGRYFEDFRLGEEILHATPRTLTEADQALTIALTGSRFALNCADPFAQALGLQRAPLDDWLVFNIVFGKTVPDISLNAIANLGYADCRFAGFVYPGDTLSARSTVIGLRETSTGDSGIVYVRSQGLNQRGEIVLDYVRWVLMQKREAGSATAKPHLPELPESVPASGLTVPPLKLEAYDCALAGGTQRFDDYRIGMRIRHPSGMTVEDACHMSATRLYQNTARVHFDQHRMAGSRFKRRLVYGGYVISVARALTFDGLENACRILAVNGGRHVAPCFGGDTIYAWSEIRDAVARGRHAGALRIRTLALRDNDGVDFPDRGPDGTYHPAVLLDLDYWALMPK